MALLKGAIRYEYWSRPVQSDQVRSAFVSTKSGSQYRQEMIFMTEASALARPSSRSTRPVHPACAGIGGIGRFLPPFAA